MGKKVIRLKLPDKQAENLGLDINTSGFYSVSPKIHKKYLLQKINEEDNTAGRWTKAASQLHDMYAITVDGYTPDVLDTDTKTNNYKEDDDSDNFFKKITAWNDDTGKVMNIDEYCEYYGFCRSDIHSWKLVSHTGIPYYNIAFKENFEKNLQDINFQEIIQRHIKEISIVTYNFNEAFEATGDFDDLTYTDTHIGMDPNPKGSSMYPQSWTKEDILKTGEDMIDFVYNNKSSHNLVINDLGDFLDGQNKQTSRGGHPLPQLMSNEECFDLGRKFKLIQVSKLATLYKKVIVNIIVNDNHSSSFAYYVASSFKDQVDIMLNNVTVNIHRQFISHYVAGEFLFIICHGKDEEYMKFGMSPSPKPQDLDKIDQYIKSNNLYELGKKIVFKKGDSHQAIFDYSASDDFWYFNYPTLAPNSDWVKHNYKKGFRGFVFETYKGRDIEQKPKFY